MEDQAKKKLLTVFDSDPMKNLEGLPRHLVASKFNFERAKVVVEAISSGANLSDAAKAAGVGTSTLKSWLRRYSRFRRAVEEAESRAVIQCEIAVRIRDPHAWLKAKRPKEWGSNVNINHLIERLDEEITGLRRDLEEDSARQAGDDKGTPAKKRTKKTSREAV